MDTDKIAAFTDILAQNPDDAFARYGLAMEYRNRNENALALREFDELNRRKPDYVPAYQMAAQTLIALGQGRQAAERLRAGIACAQRTGNRHALSEMQAMLEELEDRDPLESHAPGREKD